MSRGRSSSSGRGSSSSSSRGSSSSSGMRSSSWRSGGRRNWHSSHRTVIFWGNGSGGGPASIKALLVTGIFLFIFGGIILCCMLPAFFNGFKYAEVEAKCISNQERNSWYYTTYEYEVDGIEYVNESDEGWEFPETVGKTVTIYYLKDNPDFITELNPGLEGGDFVFVITGLAFVVTGVVLIVLYNKKKKLQNQGQETENSTSEGIGEQQNQSQSSNMVRCIYCGCRYDGTKSECPSCGAKKIK